MGRLGHDFVASLQGRQSRDVSAPEAVLDRSRGGPTFFSAPASVAVLPFALFRCVRCEPQQSSLCILCISPRL